MNNRGPRSFRPFAAVERIFAGNTFRPAVDPLAMSGEQQNAAAVGTSETRLEKMHERHLDLTDGDGFNLHSSSENKIDSPERHRITA